MTRPALFRSIKADMMRRITGGDWPLGSLLPNEVELCREYGAARTTVGRALRELVDEGLIERRRKAGTRVRQAPLRQARFEIPIVGDEIRDAGARYGYRLLDTRIGPVPAGIGARMDLPAGAGTRHLLCLHLADDAPYQLEERWINLAAVPDAADADFSAAGPSAWLVRQVPFTSAEISFSAAAADPATAAHLGCSPQTALFCAERQTRWEGRSVTFVRLTYRDGYRMTTQY